MDSRDELFALVPGEENGPDHAPRAGVERLVLVLAVLSAALAFLPLTGRVGLAALEHCCLRLCIPDQGFRELLLRTPGTRRRHDWASGRPALETRCRMRLP